MIRHVGQRRAQHWIDRLACENRSAAFWERTLSQCKSLAPAIRRHGPALAIAALLASSRHRDVNVFLIDALSDWLLNPENESGSLLELESFSEQSQPHKTLIELLILENQIELMSAMTETMAYLEWGNSLIALKCEETKKSGDENCDEAE